ncbi:FAS1 domain-containing protein [Immersiella caudata]|uniref:FAS1 domain-containing protein n=1 Tax=Immersiella caudata TaxID=314043 RepID=A0AA40BZI1_9PEZI|nr:FAS1 domain-containing protein [Immersiella caudata]
MQIKRLTPLALALVLASGISAQTLQDVLTQQNATLSVLNGFLEQQQQLLSNVANTADITVLAPSNNALSNLPSSVVNKVSTDPSFLSALLSYHILKGTYYTSNLTSSPSNNPLSIQTLLNSTRYSNVTGGQRIISTVSPSSGDINLWSGSVFPATLQTANFNFSGGTIHIIDSMLSMPSNLTDTLLNNNLTAAVGALQQSRLAAELDAQKEITVFAPNNAAFEQIGNLIGGMTQEDLQRVLEYHVLEGKVLYSGMLGNGEKEGTMQGGIVEFREEAGSVWVNGARVVGGNLLVGNGVVHVIDGVLNPDNASALPDPAAATPVPAFSGASATGGIPFTTGIVPPAATSTNSGPQATITHTDGQYYSKIVINVAFEVEEKPGFKRVRIAGCISRPNPPAMAPRVGDTRIAEREVEPDAKLAPAFTAPPPVPELDAINEIAQAKAITDVPDRSAPYGIFTMG